MQTHSLETTTPSVPHQSASLIASDRVEGTAVYRPDGAHIGTIKRVMIDKRRGVVAYAVLSFGGVLGLGDDFFPLPWAMLTYSENLGGYCVDVSDVQLARAPKMTGDLDFGERVQEAALYDYYGFTFL